MSSAIVLDASVWVSWFRPTDANHETSHRWMKQYLAKGGFIVVPTLLLIELAASISRQTQQNAEAEVAIATLNSMNTVQVVPMNAKLVQAAITVAISLRLRAGDATYVAVAQQRNIPLVSWDKEQLQRTTGIITTYTPYTHI